MNRFASTGEPTPPTQWAMFTLRVGVGGVAGAFPDWDAVPDGDLLGSDEDVFDEQPQHALSFLDGGCLGFGVELGEEAFEVRSEGEVGLPVGELVVDRLDLVVQVGFPGAQVSLLSISVQISFGSASMPVMWSQTTVSR